MSNPAAAEIRVRCRPIAEADVEAVADLLSRGFEMRPPTYFIEGMRRQGRRAVPEGLPRWGYMLEAEGRPVGAVLLMFKAVPGAEPPVRCNIASWYVEPPYRGHAAMLSAMALKHKKVTYLNVTPAPNTWPILEAQGYRRYCNGLFLSFPALSRGPAAPVEVIEPDAGAIAGLDAEETALLVGHAAYGCTSLVVRGADGPEPFVFLPFRMRSGRLPLPVMQLVYARSPERFVAHAGPIGRALLARGRLAVLMDAVGPVPGLVGLYSERRGRKYVKGPGEPRLADLTDTELVVFGP